MRVFTAIVISSFGLVGLMSLSEGDSTVTKGPRLVRQLIVSEEQIRVQQSRAWVDSLRGALLQQKARIRAKTANEGVVLRT
ncbi:hypothetical protein GGE67_005861 [Rhizobium leucaenae]|nr:hypothetical protein [Rhizobium leucaenae]